MIGRAPPPMLQRSTNYEVILPRLSALDPPVVPDKDVVTLIVEGDDSPALELRIIGEDGGEHPRHGVTQPGGEVVQDHFREVGGRSTVTLICVYVCVCACVCVYMCVCVYVW